MCIKCLKGQKGVVVFGLGVGWGLEFCGVADWFCFVLVEGQEGIPVVGVAGDFIEGEEVLGEGWGCCYGVAVWVALDVEVPLS